MPSSPVLSDSGVPIGTQQYLRTASGFTSENESHAFGGPGIGGTGGAAGLGGGLGGTGMGGAGAARNLRTTSAPNTTEHGRTGEKVFLRWISAAEIGLIELAHRIAHREFVLLAWAQGSGISCALPLRHMLLAGSAH